MIETARPALPDVTLVAIDSVAHDLTRLALEECVRRVDFAEVVVFTDRTDFSVPGAAIQHLVLTPPLRGWEAVNRVWWHEVPERLTTSHFLTVQWDSWILNPEAWDPLWLQCDYIGAPWPWHRTDRVGNGGFSLRSRRLHDHLAHHRLRYPLSHPEDDALCRRYRPMLEAEGFRWAPDAVAQRFSFERGDGSQYRAGGAIGTFPFGFHGAFNFPDVLSMAELDGRIAAANDYATGKIEWREMLKRRCERYFPDTVPPPCSSATP
jgi:hypothetical protein